VAEVEPLRPGGDAAPRIGDRGEMPPRRFRTHAGPDLIVEVFHQGEGLDGAPGLGGDDEEGPGEVETSGAGQYGAGIGGVEDGQFRKARPDAEGLPEGLRGEAGAPHPQEDRLDIAIPPDGVRPLADLRQAGGHVFGAIQPPQAIGDLRGRGFPNRMVPLPDPVHDPFRENVRPGDIDRQFSSIDLNHVQESSP